MVSIAVGPSFRKEVVLMCVTIHVPGVLREYCGGGLELSLPATSLRNALEQIERRHPALYRCVCDETGAVRRHVNMFVNTHTCATSTGSTRAHAGRRGHDPASRLRRLNMPERVILAIGTKKGLFVAEAAKARRSFALRGPFGPAWPFTRP